MGNAVRVLHVFGRLDSGGAESRTMDIYRHIDRSKVQFDFAVHTEDECFFSQEVRQLGGRIHAFPRFKGTNYREYKKAWDDFFQNHPEYDIIHGHMTTTAFIYLKRAKKHGLKKRIMHARNANKDTVIKYVLSRLGKKYATDLFAVSKLAGLSEFGKKAFKNNQVQIIPNAIEVDKYTFDEHSREHYRNEFQLSNDNKAIIHIGRFHKQKNHEFLIDIFSELRKNHSNYELFLVGDGPLKKEIMDKVKQLSLEEHVWFLGVRDDVPKLLSAMDMLVFPSLYEGLPGVVLEAQASGLPCFISDQITKEVVLSDNVKQISLNQDKNDWIETIIKCNVEEDRIQQANILKQQGFDIVDVASFYQDLYNK